MSQKIKCENLRALLVGVLTAARAVSDALHDGFQVKDLADLILKYHDQNSDFGQILDRAIEAGPRLGEELKDFEFSQLLGLVMSIYPDVEQLIGSLAKINLAGKSEASKPQLIAQTVNDTSTQTGPVTSDSKPC